MSEQRRGRLITAQRRAPGMTSLLNSTSVRSHDFYQYLWELFHLTTIFGARVFDPQHCGKSTPLKLFSGFRRERLLRVTDPRAALVAPSPRFEVCVFPSLCAEFTGLTAPFHARDENTLDCGGTTPLLLRAWLAPVALECTLLLQSLAYKKPFDAWQTGALRRTRASREWPLERIACRQTENSTTGFCYNCNKKSSPEFYATSGSLPLSPGLR